MHIKRKKNGGGFWRKFFAWGFFAAACVGYGVIMYEAAQVGSVSSEHSGAVGDLIPDDIVDDIYDSDNIIDINDFSVTFSPSKEQYYIGDSISYSYTYDPANTTYKDIILDYEPKTSVSVSNGKIVCLEEGTTTFTFTSAEKNKLVKTVSIEILPVLGTGLELGGDLNLSIGDVKFLEPVITPSNTTDKRVNFKSSNANVAVVYEDGSVKALKAGQATISASLVSNPEIKDSITVTVKEETHRLDEVISISLPENVSCFAGESYQVTGSFLPKATSNFDLSKLVVNSSDSKLSVSKKSSSINSGSFVLSLKYSDTKISEPVNATISVSYDGAMPLEAASSVTIKPLMPLTTSMVSSSLKTSYSGSIVEYTHYASKTKYNNLTLKITYSESSVNSNPKAYSTNDVKWEVPSSLKLVSSSYKQAVIAPNATDVAVNDAKVYFYPNKNLDERITFTVNYSLTSDSAYIVDVDSLLITDGMELSTGTLFEEKLDTSLTLSSLSSVSDVLLSSGVTAEIVEGNSLASLSRSSSMRPYTLETGSEEGFVTIRLTSSLDNTVTKDIHISLVQRADICLLEYNGISELSSTTMGKGTVSSLVFLTGMRNNFDDETYVDKYWEDDDFEISFSRENIFTYTKESHQLLAIASSNNEPVTITLRHNGNPSLSASIDITIDYTAPNASGFSLSFQVISFPGEGEFNKPQSFDKIAVGTSLRALGRVNEDASVQTGFYTSSDPSVLDVNSQNGVITALKKGTADIEFHSSDDPNIFIKKTIKVVESVGPISIDKDSLGAMSFSLAETYEGKEFARCKLALGKSYTLKINLPEYATCRSIRFEQDDFMGEVCGDNILSINNDGVITIKNVGKTYIHILYGDSDSLSNFEYVLEVKTERDVGSFWSTFLYKVRKLVGHFGAFMVCAMCLTLFVGIFFRKIAHKAIGVGGTLVVGFAFAGLSELVQKFTEGRYGCWADVWIDFKGSMLGTLIATAGIALVLLIKYLICRSKKKKGEGNNPSISDEKE